MDLPNPQTAAAHLKKLSRVRPSLAIVLGSGFHHVLTQLTVEKKVSYAKIPGFPRPTVSGHAGELFFGSLGGMPVVVLSGRAHFYEGHPMERVTFAVRTLAAFGVQDLLLTNAAGGVNRRFRAGDFMVVTDHINLMGVNPLRGANEELNAPSDDSVCAHARPHPGPLPRGEGDALEPSLKTPCSSARSCERGSPALPRFVDLTEVYDAGLSRILRAAAKECKVRLRSGVYLAVCGPSYETPAEIRAFARLGADAVGMSTVPEAIVARQCGLNVAAVSCITNLAAGISKTRLSHAEVLETAERVKSKGAALLTNFAKLYGREK
ncbi:MAG TPA: purine-nucleoside phosphorylase [Candidatus Angelobacter sp.]|nr:purine-nucleoside phosphorylase [Candidatus Angelobacter sp.]